jgi:hypothetical protein
MIDAWPRRWGEMFGELTATDLSPWDDFDFNVTYYGCLLSVTVLLMLANVIFLTIVLSDGSPRTRFQLAIWQALSAIGGLGIGVGFPYGHHALLRLGELVHRAAH